MPEVPEPAGDTAGVGTRQPGCRARAHERHTTQSVVPSSKRADHHWPWDGRGLRFSVLIAGREAVVRPPGGGEQESWTDITPS